jgi:endogenous inhibitor of DNA gyrase (YacG/DUF329 family)
MAGAKQTSAEVTPLRPRGKCPICGKPSDRTLHPFCSKRCANIDLSRWLSGGYAIPGRPADEAEDNPTGEKDDAES